MSRSMKNAASTRQSSEPFLFYVLLIIVFAVVGMNRAYAAGGTAGLAKLGNALPAGVIHPVPVGILYPGLTIAAGVNPAALTAGKKATAISISGAPPLGDGDPISFMGSVATSSNKVGWGIGYSGSLGAEAQHGLFAGVGFKLGQFSAGVGLRDANLSGGFNPNVDIGTRVDLGREFSMGLVAYDLDADPSVTLGVGVGHPKKDNVELNISTPPLGGGSADYALTFSATVYTGPFGTSFRTTYLLDSKTFSHTLGGLFWVGDSINLFVQLTTPRTLNVGFTYVF